MEGDSLGKQSLREQGPGTREQGPGEEQRDW